MIRILPKILGVFAAFCTLCTVHISAHCARCERIEKERVLEQTKNPPSLNYYDDQVSLHSTSTESTPFSKDSSDIQKKTVNDSSNNRQSISQETPAADRSSSLDKAENLSQFFPEEENLFLLAASYLAQNQRTQTTPEENNSSDLIHEDFFEERDVRGQERKTSHQEDSSNMSQNEDLNNRRSHVGGEGTPPSNGNRSSNRDRSYSTVFAILKTKFFLETLDGSFTLFIPTNEALRKLPPDTLLSLINPDNQEKLSALVSNHVVARKILRKDFEAFENQEIKAISGRNLTLHFGNGKLSVDGAQVLRIEPAGYDGVIYIIDKVLIP